MAEEKSTDTAGVILLPPYLFGLVFAAAVALEFIGLFRFLGPISLSGWQLWSGLGICCLAATLALWGILAFVRAGTNIPPDEPALAVVTTGPYRFTRNPMYLGILGLLFGLGLMLRLEWAIILWPVLAMLLHYGVVLREERYMTDKFGAPYEALLSRTRRWI